MFVLTEYNGIGRVLPGVRAALLMMIGFCAGANAAFAVDPRLADEVESANKLYVDGDYQGALDAYAKAQTDCPECAELAYNQGLTHYRLGDLAKARENFNEALSTNDTALEAKAKYNLGNVAYSEALANQAEAPKAIQSAQSAIDFYRDALELSPNDRDAQANIETANRFMKKLREQQQQQQQNQDQQQQDQKKDQDQEQDQQEQDQQDQEQENNDQQNNEQQQKDQQNRERNEQDQQQQDEQSKEGQDEQQQDQDQQQQQDDQQKQGGEQDEQQQADSADQQSQSQQHAEAKDLTEEEAERLLQAVRDKEAKRREELAERRKAQRVNVDKDW